MCITSGDDRLASLQVSCFGKCSGMHVSHNDSHPTSGSSLRRHAVPSLANLPLGAFWSTGAMTTTDEPDALEDIESPTSFASPWVEIGIYLSEHTCVDKNPKQSYACILF